jgi:hypothetical protein
VKKRMVQAGTSALSSLVLKRARRKAMQALNSRAQPQPMRPVWSMVQT